MGPTEPEAKSYASLSLLLRDLRRLWAAYLICAAFNAIRGDGEPRRHLLRALLHLDRLSPTMLKGVVIVRNSHELFIPRGPTDQDEDSGKPTV